MSDIGFTCLVNDLSRTMRGCSWTSHRLSEAPPRSAEEFLTDQGVKPSVARWAAALPGPLPDVPALLAMNRRQRRRARTTTSRQPRSTQNGHDRLTLPEADALLRTFINRHDGRRWPAPTRDLALTMVLLASEPRIGLQAILHYTGADLGMLELPEVCWHSLRAWLKLRECHGLSLRCHWLFPRLDGDGPVTDDSLRHMLMRRRRKAGIRRPVGPTTLLRTELDLGDPVRERHVRKLRRPPYPRVSA